MKQNSGTGTSPKPPRITYTTELARPDRYAIYRFLTGRSPQRVHGRKYHAVDKKAKPTASKVKVLRRCRLMFPTVGAPDAGKRITGSVGRRLTFSRSSVGPTASLPDDCQQHLPTHTPRSRRAPTPDGN